MLHIPFFCFTFVKSSKNHVFYPISSMKDRIRQIMESKHMTQQVFAQFIEMSPASLSSIFSGRTRPTLNIVDAIKKKIPDINLEWLMFGTGEMFQQNSPNPTLSEDPMESVQEPMLHFDAHSSTTPQSIPSTTHYSSGVRNTPPENGRQESKISLQTTRKVIEIKVFYDDQTWDTFVPTKK